MSDNSEAIEKLAGLIYEYVDGGGGTLQSEDVEGAGQAILAAFQAAPLKFVKPKPLRWLATHEHNYEAKAFGGEYLIEGRNVGYLWWVPTFRGAGTPAATLEAAQAAAETHRLEMLAKEFE